LSDILWVYSEVVYAAQLGRVDDARALLDVAISLDPMFKQLALEDEDLTGGQVERPERIYCFTS